MYVLKLGEGDALCMQTMTGTPIGHMIPLPVQACTGYAPVRQYRVVSPLGSEIATGVSADRGQDILWEEWKDLMGDR